MQGKYEENPIYELAMHLLHEFEYFVKYTYSLAVERNYSEIDPILKLILLNNGCKVLEKCAQNQLCYNIISGNDEYDLYFVTGMMGNDANEYYDFLIFNGKKVLVIFIEYFNIIDKWEFDNLSRSEDPMILSKIALGNSIYYDAIKKIVEVFYLTSEPTPGGLLTTAMHTTHRWNGSIIAIHILSKFKPIDENDVLDIPMEDIKNILDGNIKLQLYGIRTM